ncbi:MAG: glycosyltransferase family 4 protein, partial [Methyloligellaceae bacterium]
MPEIYFVSPGDPNTLTGGYLYNRRVREALRADGWIVHEVRLSDAFPFPEPDDLNSAARILSGLPADNVAVIDGLALGAFSEIVVTAIRGRVVALVHHPLAEETGLGEAQASALFESEKYALRHAAGVIVSSPHTRQSLIDRYDVPAEKIVAAVPGVERPASGQSIDEPGDGVRILSVGNLIARKGHDVLLAALSEICDLDWSATIAGSADHDPDVASALFAQCRSFGLEERIEFTGERSADALAEEYNRATVFALATRHEGYGMVFSEAMVRGLPIVSCRAGAVPDTVPDAAGLLVPPDDVRAFSGALRRMLTDTDFRKACGAGSGAAGNA